MLRDVLTARDFLEQAAGFLAAAMIEDYRDWGAESFLGSVAVDTACAAVPAHDDAFGSYADDCVARNVNDALQAGKFVMHAREFIARASPFYPNGDTDD